MVRSKNDNEQIEYVDRIDNVRRELDGKIDNRVHYVVFFGILGVLAVLVVSTISTLDARNNATTAKVDELTKRLAIVETRMDDHKK